jgi:hypothetical protein
MQANPSVVRASTSIAASLALRAAVNAWRPVRTAFSKSRILELKNAAAARDRANRFVSSIFVACSAAHIALSRPSWYSPERPASLATLNGSARSPEPTGLWR